MDQLVKRLRREFKADPKKGVVLGVMALVAAYFWVPLIWGWAKPTPVKVAKTADPNADFLPQLAASTPSAATPSPAGFTPQPWYQTVERMNRDLRKQSAALAADQRDPFHLPDKLVETPAERREIPPSFSPETLGLVLSGTIVGTGRRVALINGKNYCEGAMIELKKDGQSVVLKLVEIRAQEAVVQYEGRDFALTLPQHKHEGRIESRKSLESP